MSKKTRCALALAMLRSGVGADEAQIAQASVSASSSPEASAVEFSFKKSEKPGSAASAGRMGLFVERFHAGFRNVGVFRNTAAADADCADDHAILVL